VATRWWKKFEDNVYSFWHNPRTWRTDRQTDTAWRHRLRLCIASRGKNYSSNNLPSYLPDSNHSSGVVCQRRGGNEVSNASIGVERWRWKDIVSATDKTRVSRLGFIDDGRTESLSKTRAYINVPLDTDQRQWHRIRGTFYSDKKERNLIVPTDPSAF